MDKTMRLRAGRSGVQIPGRGKCSLTTIIAVDARVKYPLYLSLPLYIEKKKKKLNTQAQFC